jgi:hypothetical protein
MSNVTPGAANALAIMADVRKQLQPLKNWDELGPFRHSRHSSSHNDNDSNERQDDPAPKHDDCLALAVGLP